jgi:serine/threonine protein kinase
MHKEYFVHRDIKPSNFVIGATAQDRTQIYLLDFGLARSLRNMKGKNQLRTQRLQNEVLFRGTSM